MASPKELAPLVPETLPEDFGDWDSEAAEAAAAAAAPPPVNRTRWAAWDAAPSVSKTTAKPLAQSVDREAFLSPTEDGLRNSRPASSAPVIAKQPELTNKPVNGSASRATQKVEARQTTHEVPVAPALPKVAKVDATRNAPRPVAKTRREAEEAVFQVFSPKNIKVKLEPKTAKKNWMPVAAISAGSVLAVLVLTITLLHHGTKAAAKNSVQPVPGASNTQQNTPNGKPSAQGKTLPTTDKQPATGDQPAPDDTAVTPADAPTPPTTDQVTAPARIPKQVAENEPAPANLNVAGADGMGGGSASPSIFSGHTQPTVKVASSKPVAISSGIATGMLIQMTPPVYPAIAKSARISGTVVLHATISTNGAIKDLQVVTGPIMLRQSALDAVRSWRYKPYMLNNAPVEVETTINVVFTLGG